jgi:predicted nuclease of predicted toxin-antitoxin system
MPLSPTLARWLVTEGHDAVHAVDCGLASADDADVIERARQDSRTIVTADLDYPRLLAFGAAREPSLILFRGGNWSESEVIQRIQQLLNVLEADELERSILVVERDRVRRRVLPVGRDDPSRQP